MIRRLFMAYLVGLAACQTPAPESLPGLSAGRFSMADVQAVTSTGGVTAWLVEESFVPTVAIEMAWSGRARTQEPAGREVLGWLLAYMMNEGAGDLDTTAYGARTEDLSIQFGCRTGMDWIHCGLMTLTATADDSFEMLRMAFADLRLDDGSFARARRELSVGIAAEDKQPRTIASRTMNEVLIPHHPYVRYPTQDLLGAASTDEMRELMRQLMTKDRLLVVVVGDISAEELKLRVDQVFSGLPQSGALPDVVDAVAGAAPAPPVVKILEQPQTPVMFPGPGVKREDADFYAAYLLNYILGGGGLSSRLFDELREKRGLAYGVAAALQPLDGFKLNHGSDGQPDDAPDPREHRPVGQGRPDRAGDGGRQGLHHRSLPAGFRFQRQDRAQPDGVPAG